MQPSFFSSAQLADEAVLLVWRKKEKFKKLSCTERFTVCKWEMLCNIFYIFNHPHVLFDGKTLLRVISKYDGVANVDFATIGLFQSLQHIYKGGFTSSVFSYNSNSFSSFKGVVKTGKDCFFSKSFIYFDKFCDFATQPAHLHLQVNLPVFYF